MKEYGLSKSSFVKGWFCHNLLWWYVHDPDAEEFLPGPVLLDRFEQGREVGELARNTIPDGVLVDLPEEAFRERIAATQAHLDAGAPAVFEAAFAADDVFVTVDVLERAGSEHDVVEVKSSTRVKEEHLLDVAIQAHVIGASGVAVRRTQVMHLNPDYRHPAQGPLFVREDVTPQVLQLLPQVPAQISSQKEVLGRNFPGIPLGLHCASVSECPFRGRCWPEDEDHILTLHGKGIRKALELMDEGIHRIPDLPDEIRLSEVAERQRRAVERQTIIVEPGLADALEALQHPLGFLDFETVSRAVPTWEGLAPWATVPVQFSYHEEDRRGAYRHAQWLATGPEDPRRALALALIDASRRAAQIVVYTGFESRQIKGLKEALPDLRDQLEAIEGRFVDLHKIIKGSVYHPGFQGSFGLKRVLPVLVPDLTYSDLEISDGMEASVTIARLMLRSESYTTEEQARLQRALLAYCERDTWAMVRLLDRLRTLGHVQPGSSARRDHRV